MDPLVLDITNTQTGSMEYNFNMETGLDDFEKHFFSYYDLSKQNNID